MHSSLTICFLLSSILTPVAVTLGKGETIHYISKDISCQIPELGQWSLKKFQRKKSYVACNNVPHLVKVVKDGDLYFAVIDEHAVPYYARSIDFISCTISNITRGSSAQFPDQEIHESIATPFDSEIKSEMLKDTVRVKCYSAEEGEAKVIYENIFGAYVPYNIETRGRPLVKNPYNVLMIIVDSVSKYSFPYLMPKTYMYLRKNDFKLLHGYSQLDRVALPNIIPILTGYSITEAVKKYGIPFDTFFDIYEFVWYEFYRYGYTTIFAEDFSKTNTFNRHYRGFWNQPTDYYFRALSLAVDLLNTTYLDKMPYCTGPETSAERILNLAANVTTAFRNRPYFGLFWLNTFSHDDYNAPRRMDLKLKKFFEDIRPNLNKTIVFFFSDHGYYKESITSDVENSYGSYESKSPFHFVYIPPTFEKKHSECTDNFNKNLFKMISPYDIYATLQHILLLGETNHFPHKPKSCDECRSIFKEIPSDRNCSSTGFDRESCICVTGTDAKLRMPAKVSDGDKELTRDEHIVRAGTAKIEFLFYIYFLLVGIFVF